MVSAFLIFLTSFIYVFAKAFQQRNVIHNNWKMIPVFSYMMAFLELTMFGIAIIDIDTNGWHRILILGLAQGSGGTLGCWSAMWSHDKVSKKK